MIMKDMFTTRMRAFYHKKPIKDCFVIMKDMIATRMSGVYHHNNPIPILFVLKKVYLKLKLRVQPNFGLFCDTSNHLVVPSLRQFFLKSRIYSVFKTQRSKNDSHKRVKPMKPRIYSLFELNI